MSSWLLSLYILVWPVISLAILVLLLVSLRRDLRAAKEEGRGMV